MDDGRCGTCPVAAADPCLGATRPGVCVRAARPGEDAFRRSLVARARVPFPPLATRAAGLAGAAARFVASGLEVATAEERARRLGICRECPEFVDGKCLRCGCRLRWKIMSAAEHCPLDPPLW